MGDDLIHVNHDPGEFGAVYEPSVLIPGDVERACEKIVADLDQDAGASKWKGSELARATREEFTDRLHSLGLFEEGPPIRTAGALRTVRSTIPEDTIVTTDVGGHRIWTKNSLPVYGAE
jgi:acetolactate synthase-1/2/3 large subunit